MQLCESLVSLAELQFRDGRVLVAYCDQLASRLHSLTAADVGRCIWAFSTLGLAQAPAYPRMMRAIDQKLHSLPAELICQLIRAITPLGRAAACGRLLPRLVLALSTASPAPSFAELLTTARVLSTRLPLVEPLLLQLQSVIREECSGEGEGPMAGKLSTTQLVLALWLFVRHLPLLQQTSPASQLLQLLPPTIERLLYLVADLEQLSSEQLVDMLQVMARLRRPNAPVMLRLLKQVDSRIARQQLRLPQMIEAGWSMFELYGKAQSDLMERLAPEIGVCARQVGPEQMVDTLRLLGQLPMRRPWPLMGEISKELIAAPSLPDQLLTDLFDALARLRYDDPQLLDALEIHADRAIDRGTLHEAQAGCILEALGALQYSGRTGSLVVRLLTRLRAAESLMPHTAVAVMHGAAQLRLEPSPLSVDETLEKMAKSQLVLDLPEAATMLWSLVELGQADAAMRILEMLLPELGDQAATCDLHSLNLVLWCLLTLRQHEHHLLRPVFQACARVASGIRAPSQLCRYAEIMLMLQLEASATGLALPAEITARARAAWRQCQMGASQAAPSPQLREVSAALEALGLRHAVQALNTYMIDALVPRDSTGG